MVCRGSIDFCVTVVLYLVLVPLSVGLLSELGLWLFRILRFLKSGYLLAQVGAFWELWLHGTLRVSWNHREHALLSHTALYTKPPFIASENKAFVLKPLFVFAELRALFLQHTSQFFLLLFLNIMILVKIGLVWKFLLWLFSIVLKHFVHFIGNRCSWHFLRVPVAAKFEFQTRILNPNWVDSFNVFGVLILGQESQLLFLKGFVYLEFY